MSSCSRPQDRLIHDGEDKVPLRSTQHGNATEEIAESMQMVACLERIGEVYSFGLQFAEVVFFGKMVRNDST